MSNRRAASRTRYLSREPRTLLCKFTSTGATGDQTLTDSGPFNHGIVNVNCTANGTYVIALGSGATSRDTYAGLAGVDFVVDETDRKLNYATDGSTTAANPTVTLYVTESAVGTEFITNTKIAWVRLHFVDSAD